MIELHRLAAPLAFVYVSAAAGVVIGRLLLAWFSRGERQPTVFEAGLCAVLPPLAVLATPLASTIHPHLVLAPHWVHESWHAWTDRLHAAPVFHATLHLVNLATMALAAWGASRLVYSLAQQSAGLSFLRRSGRLMPSAGLPVYVVQSSDPICFTAGIVRPGVFVSERLLSRVSPADWRAALAHEAAHFHRRDPLTAAVLGGFYLLFPLPGGSLLLSAWLAAVECRCDTLAAHSLGDPLAVARAILRAALLTKDTNPSVVGGLALVHPGADVEGRIRSLLSMNCGPSRATDPTGRLAQMIPVASAVLGVCAVNCCIRHVVDCLASH